MDDAIIRQRLLAGERILWSGLPGQGLLFSRRDILLIPFSLVWCSFAVFWTLASARDGAPGFFTLWGTMFIGFGLYMVAGRFVLDIWLRRATCYAVTDRRLLIARSGPLGRFTAIGLHPLPEIALDERDHGRGTIRLGQAAPFGSYRGIGVWSPALDATPQFIAIEDAQHVFDLIQRTSAPS